MAWYWYLFVMFLIFNVGFMCGAWVGSSTVDGLFRMKGVSDRFVHSDPLNHHEDLRVQKDFM